VRAVRKGRSLSGKYDESDVSAYFKETEGASLINAHSLLSAWRYVSEFEFDVELLIAKRR
jgi:hypothetical protein